MSIRGHFTAWNCWLANSDARGFRAVESARRNEQNETAARDQMDSAFREAELGNREQARHDVAAALALASSRDTQIEAALIFARIGDFARAQKMSDDLAKRFPANTLLNNYWLPSIHAAIEIGQRNPSKVIESLQPAVPYELAVLAAWPSHGGPIYPAYLRGQAYLLLRQGNEAAAEISKILRSSRHHSELHPRRVGAPRSGPRVRCAG